MIATAPAQRSRVFDPAPRKPLPSSLKAAESAYKRAVQMDSFIEIFAASDVPTLSARKCVMDMLALEIEHDTGLIAVLEGANASLDELREEFPGVIESSPALTHLAAIVAKLTTR